MNNNIIFLNPVFTHNIWGGNRLSKEYGYAVEGNDIGECWGISAHPNGDCTVLNGQFAGKTLSQLWKEEPELFNSVDSDRFPLLTKIIDAREDLSIQVHPDDIYANAHENGSLGKTECWYILDCNEDATLVVGHNASSKEELTQWIQEGQWDKLIREVPVKKGSFVQIDPGTVHAIKGGILLLETQQNSDITYRVYDYDRLSEGKPRELHIDKSIDVITIPAKEAKDAVIDASVVPANQWNALIANDFYRVWKLEVDQYMSFEQEMPFMLLTVVEGSGTLNQEAVKKGDHFILPAGFGKVELEGNLTLIVSSVNE